MKLVSRSGSAASGQAAWLFAMSGLLAFAAILTPGAAPRMHLVAVGVADVAAAVAIAALPWRRWHRTATLAILVPAFVLVGVSSAVGLIPVRTYGVFFVLLFAWVGVHHPTGTAWKLVPLLIVGYVVPIVITHADPPLDQRAPLLTAVLCVLVAETIARGARAVAEARDREAEARARADRTAKSFRTVAKTSASLRQLDPRDVLEEVVDGMMELGYDGATLSVIHPEDDTYEPILARGIAVHYAGRRYPIANGVPGIVRDAGAPVAIADYQSWELAVPEVREAGIESVLGVPVVIADALIAVLVATFEQRTAMADEDVEALEALAAVAGAALLAAEQYQHARTTAEREAHAAQTDTLTGLGNRRAADDYLADAHPGDALVMLDLDHFRQVNEHHGHAGGDQVLAALGDHLRAWVRAHDRVARSGGEEFVVVLPRTELAEATTVVERLLVSWRATDPVTTFSVGIAVVHADETVEDALARADRALYDAKRRGRDQHRTQHDLIALATAS